MKSNSPFVDSQTGMRYASFIERVSGEGSRAWDIHNRAEEMAKDGRDIILLSIGDPDFDTPPPIIDAVVESLRRGRAAEGMPPESTRRQRRASRIEVRNPRFAASCDFTLACPPFG